MTSVYFAKGGYCLDSLAEVNTWPTIQFFENFHTRCRNFRQKCFACGNFDISKLKVKGKVTCTKDFELLILVWNYIHERKNSLVLVMFTNEIESRS